MTTISVSLRSSASLKSILPLAIFLHWSAELYSLVLLDICFGLFGPRRHVRKAQGYTLMYRLDVDPTVLARVAHDPKGTKGDDKTPSLWSLLEDAKIWLSFDAENVQPVVVEVSPVSLLRLLTSVARD